MSLTKAVMKKQEKSGTPVKPPLATSTPRLLGMKESRSDQALSSKQKTALAGKPTNSPLGKTYLSKSHENLSSHQKKKLLTYIEHRPKSSLGFPAPGTPGKSSNKENLLIREKEKNGGFLKPRPVKSAGITPMRKASSTQHIDKTGSAPPKAQSLSNKMQSIKRAHSTQNVSKDKSLRKQRTSAPADVMAYNAELLANFEKDKRAQEARISELIQMAESRKAEIEKYKYEIRRLKETVASHDGLKEDFEMLQAQNKELQDKLKELGYHVETITDTEKLLLRQSSQAQLMGSQSSINECRMLKSKSCDSLSTDGAKGPSLPISFKRTPSVSASEPGILYTDMCVTPDHPSMLSMDNGHWEKGSNKSMDALSDISVQCLTERILQMEENHYSTNEELQATLQELGDLQDSLNEMTDDNERLADEKDVLLESLCAQTQKLEHCRTQIEHLKCLLLSGNIPDKTDREQQLLELLSCATQEREELLRKQIEFANALHATETENRETQDIVDALRDKVQLQDDKIMSLKSEREAHESQVIQSKETIVNDQIELERYKTLLENEKSKVVELEQCRKAVDKSDLEELLHNARQEKNLLEDKLTNGQEALAHSQSEVARLKEQMLIREEELKVSKNNAKSQVGDLEYKLKKLDGEHGEMQQSMESLREHIDQLQQDCDRYLEDKKTFKGKLADLQTELSVSKQENSVLENELVELRGRYKEESEDWTQFQKDLQVAVVIANDFRSETQEGMEKVAQDNYMLKERCHRLESEVERLKEEIDGYKIRRVSEGTSKPTIMTSAELKGKVMCSVDRELAALRDGRKLDTKNQSVSVKKLISSIEEQVKSGCSSIHTSTCSSRRNSDSTDFGDFVNLKSPTSPVNEAISVFSPEMSLKSVLKKPAERPSPLQRHSVGTSVPFDAAWSPGEPPKSAPPTRHETSPTVTSILTNRGTPRRISGTNVDSDASKKEGGGKDPLYVLAKLMGGSKRNALLKWCQQKTVSYNNVDITNFSSSWNDGLGFCALIHCYLPDKIPFAELDSEDKRRNFTLAFTAAESVGIPSILNINDMVAMERPDWQAVMSYVTSIYKHLEFDKISSV